MLWVLLRYVKLKTMTDIFLLNLSLSDLMIVLSLPLWACNFQNSLLFAGNAPCKLMTGIYQVRPIFTYLHTFHNTIHVMVYAS